MTKFFLIVALVGLAVAGVLLGWAQQRLAGVEAAREKAALEAVQGKRAVLEANTKGLKEIARWKATAARHEAEVKRLRSRAAVAAKEVRAVHKAGEALVASGTTEEILAALRARGYHPERCGAVGK